MYLLLDWLFSNFKNFIPNKSRNSFKRRRKLLVLLLALYSSNAIAKSYTCHSFYQKFPPIAKVELAGTALTENSGTLIPASAMSYAFTPVLAPSFIFAKLVAKYTNADL